MKGIRKSSPLLQAAVRCYSAPTRDIKFLFNDVLDMQKHYQKVAGGKDATPDVIDGVIEGISAMGKELEPLNWTGDDVGCKLANGVVTTPPGFKEIYKQFCEAGWAGLCIPQEYGGQGLPASLNCVKSEIVAGSNWSFGMYPGLSQGCVNTLLSHGTPEQKKTYVPNLASGIWSGTMCLTEAQCGSDLAQVKTRAEPQADGSYKITGSKIFISCGEHDMAENIIHIVLARLPGAPKGTKGISLFVVPKFFPDTKKRNTVTCGAIEHKMGIHASSTCVMNFDEATGWLVGTPNRGLNHMFTFINTSRIGTAIQGVTATDLSYQLALAYAKERRAMRSPNEKKWEKEHVADRIIMHPDIRRLLLTQKAIAEGGRAMLYECAMLQDYLMGSDSQAKKADDELSFLTPILKGFLTDLAIETTNHGIQVFGGHGFIKQNKVEQVARDARIASLYEGTTGIQALDLLGRKIMLHSKMGSINRYTWRVFKDSLAIAFKGKDWTIAKMGLTIAAKSVQWLFLAYYLALSTGLRDRNYVGSGAVDFLMYSGYVTMGYYWLRMTAAAKKKLPKAEENDKAFYKSKIQTAEFYFSNLIHRTKALRRSMLSNPKYVMQVKESDFTLPYQ